MSWVPLSVLSEPALASVPIIVSEHVPEGTAIVTNGTLRGSYVIHMHPRAHRTLMAQEEGRRIARPMRAEGEADLAAVVRAAERRLFGPPKRDLSAFLSGMSTAAARMADWTAPLVDVVADMRRLLAALAKEPGSCEPFYTAWPLNPAGLIPPVPAHTVEENTP